MAGIVPQRVNWAVLGACWICKKHFARFGSVGLASSGDACPRGSWAITTYKGDEALYSQESEEQHYEVLGVRAERGSRGFQKQVPERRSRSSLE